MLICVLTIRERGLISSKLTFGFTEFLELFSRTGGDFMEKSTKVRRNWGLGLFLGVICMIFFWAAITDLWARPYRLGKIPDKGAKFGCGTCHVNPAGGGARNDFGKDYGKVAVPAGEKYTGELGTTDSDGDGYSNDQEFAAGTHPGDPKSKPDN
jgi:hypothetical protein